MRRKAEINTCLIRTVQVSEGLATRCHISLQQIVPKETVLPPGFFFFSGLIVKSRAHKIENSHRLEIKCWPSLELKGQLKGTGALQCEFKFSMTCKIKYFACSEQDLKQYETLKARAVRVTCTAISYQLVSFTWAHRWHQRTFDRFPGTIIAWSNYVY